MRKLNWFKTLLFIIISLFFYIPLAAADAATLDSITISPASPSITPGQTHQFKVIGNYSDGSQQDITALASYRINNSIANIDHTGRATPIATIAGSGSAVVEVLYQGKKSTTTITITPIETKPQTTILNTASNAANTAASGSALVNLK